MVIGDATVVSGFHGLKKTNNHPDNHNNGPLTHTDDNMDILKPKIRRTLQNMNSFYLWATEPKRYRTIKYEIHPPEKPSGNNVVHLDSVRPHRR